MKRHWIFGVIFLCLVGGATFYFFTKEKKSTVFEEKKKNATISPTFDPQVSKEDEKRIDRLISTIARTPAISLLFKEGELKKLGAILDENVPPLTFLAYIFSHPKRVEDMRLIQRSSMKYDNFIQGLQENLLKEEGAGVLYTKAEGFAFYLKRDPKEVKKILEEGVGKAKNGDKKAFRLFVDYLISTSSTH